MTKKRWEIFCTAGVASSSTVLVALVPVFAMASFGVSLPDIDLPAGNFNSYSLYEADISDSAYQAPTPVRFLVLEIHLRLISLLLAIYPLILAYLY